MNATGTYIFNWARDVLGASSVGFVLGPILLSGTPFWAQVTVTTLAALLFLAWTRLPDSDSDGIPDWFERGAPRTARLLEKKTKEERAELIRQIEEWASEFVTGRVGDEDEG